MSERIWDGRGEALDDARLTTADGRMADDLRLKGLHFRIMAHVGRQNHRRGWLRVSQTELAERWQCHRVALNRAFKQLVEWSYLLQQTQEEAGESFCLYKVALDGEADEGPAPAKPAKTPLRGVQPTGYTPSERVAAGGCNVQVTPVQPTGYTCVAAEVTPPSAPYISSRAHRLSPTDADSTPPPPPVAVARAGEGEDRKRNSGLQTRGWAKGWDEAARNAVYDLMQTDRRHVATALLLPLVGTLNPPAGVHGASFVRDLAEQVGGWPEPVLQRLGEAVRVERVRDLPAASKLRQMTRAVATLMTSQAQQAADAAPPRPSTDAWLAALNAGNPNDPCNAFCRRLVGRVGADTACAWFDQVAIERHALANGGGRLVVTLPNKFLARYVESRMFEDVRLAARAEWPDVAEVKIVARSAAA